MIVEHVKVGATVNEELKLLQITSLGCDVRSCVTIIVLEVHLVP